MFGEEVNSVAIVDLFHVIHMNFQLTKLAFFKFIPNLKNPSFNKLYNIIAIKKVFNASILKLHSILFSLDIFDFLLKIFKNRILIIKIGRGSKLWLKSLDITYFFNFLFLEARKSLIFTIFKDLSSFLKIFIILPFTYFKRVLKLFSDFFIKKSFSFKFNLIFISFTLIVRRE